jgi:anaphase-promoting complex subunit 5
MSRYLTPSKLSLLVLVSLYCDSIVPNRAIIPVLSFVVSHLVPATSSPLNAPTSETGPEPAISISEFEKLTISHQSSVPGRSLLDLFLKRLWAINCLDALHEFFHRLNDFLARSPDQIKADGPTVVPPRPSGRILLSRVSPLGIFLRRAQLEFTRIQFHDTVTLWTAFVKFRAPTEATWKKRNPAAAGLPLDASLADLEPEQADELLNACYGSSGDGYENAPVCSSEDIEKILEFQLDRLQSNLNPHLPLLDLC